MRHFLAIMLSLLLINGLLSATTTGTTEREQKDKRLETYNTQKVRSLARHHLSPTANGKQLKLQRSNRTTDRLIIKYKARTTDSLVRESIVRKHQLQIKKYLPMSRLHVYKAPTGTDKSGMDKLIKELRQNDQVEYVEPDYIVSVDTVPNDPFYSQLYGLHNTGQTGGTADSDIDAQEAWGLNTGSSNVIVAVIDTGVDYNHNDLAANMWHNPGEIPGDSTDNDGNGYIDDVYGINAITNSGDPWDDHYHGTHCAGTIGAVGNNGTGVVGVCWTVKIMALKFLNSGGSGYSSDAITCIEYAVANGAHIMSNSWGGGGFSQALNDAIVAAKNAGVLFIAAAGNSGTNNDISPHYPSSYTVDNVIAVAATDRYDQLAYFSCFGATSVDVAAPGVGIYSTVPGNGYNSLSGTSMATPHVAGLAALIKADDPTATWSQIKSRILETVEVKTDLQGRVATEGRVNAYDALNNSPRPEISITNPTANSFVSGSVAVQVSVTREETIAKMEFFVDDQLKHTITAAPWQYDWATTAHTDDMHVVKVVVTDSLSRTSQGVVQVRVHNAATPAVFVSQPGSGATVTMQTDIQAEAFYPAGVSKVEFYIDEVKIGEDATAPYQLTWNSRDVDNGAHQLKTKAIGTDLQVGESSVSINTDNLFLPASERNALIALYNSTNGDLWDNNYGWKKEDGSFSDEGTEADWYGVYIEDNHVVYIDLAYNELTGVLPPEIGDFPQLQHLWLYWNWIGGALPAEIGNLTLLETLDLDDNDLTGALPVELGNLTHLEELWINDNSFTGGIPAEIGNLTSLVYFFAYSATLSGSIPAEIGNMSALTVCYLDDNQLTGAIPPEMGSMASLESLTLYWNELTGEIPPELGNLSQLDHLDLDGNNLSGVIPPELGNLSNLRILWLKDNDFSGSIPPELGNLTSLLYLYLNETAITGAIPEEIGNLVNLKWLLLTANRLSGAIPDTLLNLTNLQYMDMRYNALYTANDSVRALLASYSSDWEATQTVAPGGFSAVAVSENTIQLAWSPIFFTGYTGGYRVYYSTAPEGPYTLSHTTADKLVSVTTKGGLAAETTYYFKLQTVTDPHRNSPNTVESEYTASVSATTMPMPSITVLTPNGGETYNGITSGAITWTSEGLVNNVKIEYSTAGTGGTYIPLVDSLPDTGSTNWLVPNVDSTQCIIRITSVSGNAADSSNAVFTIRPTPVLTVTSPNGGDSWPVESSQVITWDSEFYQGNIKLQLYKNNSYVRDISPGLLPVDNGSFGWTVPADLNGGSDYKVRVLSESGSVEDYSDHTFSILPPYIQGVNQPDFNGDGHPDILLRNYSHGMDLVWLMNNSAKVGKIWLPTISNTTWSFEGTADFNGDSKPDILLRNYSSGANLVWFMDGGTQIGKAWLPTIPDTNWRVDGLADFNGDGKTDILLRNYSHGMNLVWYMDGVTKIGKVWLPRISNTTWHFDGAADLNGDGKADILLRNYSSGANLVWFMNGGTQIGKAWLPTIPDTSWHINGLADFSGDGKTDILLRNYRHGMILIWNMNGVTKIGKAWLPTIPDTYWHIEN